MMIGYRTCDGIPFGKEYENEMKHFAIPSVYVCERNNEGYACKVLDNNVGSQSHSHSHPLTNLSSYHHENIISNDIYDSFLKDVLYTGNTNSVKPTVSIQLVEIPISNTNELKHIQHKTRKIKQKKQLNLTRKKKGKGKGMKKEKNKVFN